MAKLINALDGRDSPNLQIFENNRNFIDQDFWVH